MNENQFLEVLAAGWKKIAVFAVVTALFGAAVSLAFPLEHSSTMRLLMIQRQLSDVDPYTAMKGAERISDNLAKIIYTTSFYGKVMAAGFNIDESYFKQDDQQRRKQWSAMISTAVITGSGMLEVSVYHEDPAQATQIARAIAFVLTTEGEQYIGGELEVKLVDEPLASRWPTKPNIPGNAVTGLVLGGVAGAVYVAAIDGRRKRQHRGFLG
jgi:capsular polysaccharide biosynthesis protein